MTEYRADLHAHSINRWNNHFPYPSSRKDTVKAAYKKGVNIFSLSEKENPMEAYNAIKGLCENLGIITLPAQEVASRDGDILAIGITEEIKKPRKMDCYEATDKIKEQGAKAIATHPGLPKGSLSRNQVLDLYRNNKIIAADVVTGAVDANPLFMLRHRKNIKWANKNGIKVVGFSDAKRAGQIGACTTLYDLENPDKESVLKNLGNPSGIKIAPNYLSSLEKIMQTYDVTTLTGTKQLLNNVRRYVV
ncbi:MAG: hypothetical protein JW700_03815 [Candidatus Aenigmarchaeota archaeon]|nr:hypothetical protein [Candidatus Aenigmarchaeota archaeon]